MKAGEVVRAWGRILLGHLPSLSIEITRECPLTCPGCYAYGDDHVGGGVGLASVADYRGSDLVRGILDLIHRHRPLHVSLVGGEPLVRYRELTELLPQIAALGIHTQIVTSAVRPIPLEWRDVHNLRIVVSIDGLQPEHDARRKPATYERILGHIEDHEVTVHCTVTSQMTHRAAYLRDFVDFWNGQRAVRRIWMSLFTPQIGETSEEILSPQARARVIEELAMLRGAYPKLECPDPMLDGFREPPTHPDECIFARTTMTYTADLEQTITPCQLGGEPDCAQCGCVASAGLTAVGRHRLPGGLRVGAIYERSHAIGRWVAARSRPPRTARPLVPAVDLDPAADQ